MLARLVLAAVVALAIPTCAFAAPERWTPASTTARFIGPLSFSPDRIDLGRGKFMQLAPGGTTPLVDDSGERVSATIYRVIGKSPGGDGLCEGKAAFVLVWQPAPIGSDIAPRSINAFRGNRFVMNGPDDCGVARFDAGRRR